MCREGAAIVITNTATVDVVCSITVAAKETKLLKLPLEKVLQPLPLPESAEPEVTLR
jgi:hypothetical protein